MCAGLHRSRPVLQCAKCLDDASGRHSSRAQRQCFPSQELRSEVERLLPAVLALYNPLDWPKNKCQQLRQIADKEGIEILGVAANNDFSNPVPEVREAQICLMHKL